MTLGNPALTVGGDNASPAAYSGVISDSGSGTLTKISGGTLTQSNATNTYGGITTVSAGTLPMHEYDRKRSGNPTATGINHVIVNGGGTISGTGLIFGQLIINAGTHRERQATGVPVGIVPMTLNGISGRTRRRIVFNNGSILKCYVDGAGTKYTQLLGPGGSLAFTLPSSERRAITDRIDRRNAVCRFHLQESFKVAAAIQPSKFEPSRLSAFPAPDVRGARQPAAINASRRHLSPPSSAYTPASKLERIQQLEHNAQLDQ